MKVRYLVSCLIAAVLFGLPIAASAEPPNPPPGADNNLETRMTELETMITTLQTTVTALQAQLDAVGPHFSGDYGDLTNAPTLALVASTGDYDDLDNQPVVPDFASVEADITALQDLLAGVSRFEDPNFFYDTIRFSGMNVQIVNGEADFPDSCPEGWGCTGTTNGTGNLIIGYNEVRAEQYPEYLHLVNRRSGSHMLVVGRQHNYTSFGGIVVGHQNETSGQYSSVTGGWDNEASGSSSTVSGGIANLATGSGSSVSGGVGNEARGINSSVSGSGRTAVAYLCWEGGNTVDC